MDFIKAIELIKTKLVKNNLIIELKTDDSKGYYLAEDIISDVNIPNFNTSMRDGYAFKYINSCNNYILQEEQIYAGTELLIFNNSGCVYITTGGILPNNCDTIEMIENTTVKNKHIILNNIIKKNQWVRHIGSDIKKGSTILTKGHKLNSCSISTLISIGIKLIKVYKKITIGILSTGDELINSENIKQEHEIYDINRPLIINLLKDYNIIDYLILNDNYEISKNKILEILNKVDVLITSGGISMGKKDFI